MAETLLTVLLKTPLATVVSTMGVGCNMQLHRVPNDDDDYKNAIAEVRGTRGARDTCLSDNGYRYPEFGGDGNGAGNLQ